MTDQLSPPIAKTEMLIRQPAAEVFRAFVDPEVTSNFWFTKGSGKLEPRKTVTWAWEMYDVSIQVAVKSIEPNKRILIEWPMQNGPGTVEWTFTARADGTTFVSIVSTGFRGTADEMAKEAIDTTEGFALVLAGCKAFLEHGIRLKLVADRFPPPA